MPNVMTVRSTFPFRLAMLAGFLATALAAGASPAVAQGSGMSDMMKKGETMRSDGMSKDKGMMKGETMKNGEMMEHGKGMKGKGTMNDGMMKDKDGMMKGGAMTK